MPTGLIQGYNAVLSLLKDDWVTFLCSTDVSISLDADELPIRTIGSGHWKRSTYQNLSYSVTLSGLIKFDDTGYTSWDAINDWLNFNAITFRIAFTDDNGDTRSVQGDAIIKNNTLSYSVGTLVKTDIQLTGTGELMVFDGLFPCDTSIDSITVVEAMDSSGDAAITYTYSGAPYQVKYRVDGTGNYIYSLIGNTINVLSGTVGIHSIEIIPVCSNSYEGTGLTQSYTITTSLTCASVMTDITITSSTATPVYTGTPATFNYQVDGGAIITGRPISTTVSIGSLSAGSHTIEMWPVCSNSVVGTPFTKTFSVASQPAQSIISWEFDSFVAGNSFQIYVNGILVVNSTAGGSAVFGNITVNTGDSVRGVLQGNNNSGSLAELQTQDTTLSSVLDTRSGNVGIILQYTFTTNGDAYSILGTITP